MPDTSGRIEVICGPMFSGKTTAMIARLLAARELGLNTIAVKPDLDTRYSSHEIVSHDGAAHEAVNVRDASAMRVAAGRSAVMGIDEVHFFDESVVPVCQDLAAAGTRVIATGVEIDHRGLAFETIRLLIDVADEVTRLTANCARCGQTARHSQRLSGGGARIVVGGTGMYEPRCDRCFEPGS